MEEEVESRLPRHCLHFGHEQPSRQLREVHESCNDAKGGRVSRINLIPRIEMCLPPLFSESYPLINLPCDTFDDELLQEACRCCVYVLS